MGEGGGDVELNSGAKTCTVSQIIIELLHHILLLSIWRILECFSFLPFIEC